MGKLRSDRFMTLPLSYSIFQTDLLSAGVFTLHCLERIEVAARWFFNQVLVILSRIKLGSRGSVNVNHH